jgi:hypothetical protein
LTVNTRQGNRVRARRRELGIVAEGAGGGEGERRRGEGWQWGLKLYDKWAPELVVGVEYEI